MNFGETPEVIKRVHHAATMLELRHRIPATSELAGWAIRHGIEFERKRCVKYLREIARNPGMHEGTARWFEDAAKKLEEAPLWD